jgi:tyrosyl-tRNA synthetase
MNTEIITDEAIIDEVLTRAVAQVIPRDETREKLLSGKQLRIKLGVDPTSRNLHLGRSVPLLKLRDFQKLGHIIVFIVGDFTALIGDTSDKDAGRPMLTKEQVQENLETYKMQIGKILDLEKVEFCYNSDWLGKLDYNQIGEHCDCFSVSDFISRELVAKRLAEGKRVSLREMLYPVMQGYDSVAIRSDIELGGSDQIFNVLAGRTLQEHFGQEKQSVITFNLIDGVDGRKASSSWGNTINFLDTPEEMFGKLMSLHDRLIITYFESVTRIAMNEIAAIKEKLALGENPISFKKQLAREIVTMYHSELEAQKAAENWEQTFSKGGIPENIPEITAKAGESLREILKRSNLVESNSQWKRSVEEGSVKYFDKDLQEIKIVDSEFLVTESLVVKIGKKVFVSLQIYI